MWQRGNMFQWISLDETLLSHDAEFGDVDAGRVGEGAAEAHDRLVGRRGVDDDLLSCIDTAHSITIDQSTLPSPTPRPLKKPLT